MLNHTVLVCLSVCLWSVSLASFCSLTQLMFLHAGRRQSAARSSSLTCRPKSTLPPWSIQNPADTFAVASSKAASRSDWHIVVLSQNVTLPKHVYWAETNRMFWGEDKEGIYMILQYTYRFVWRIRAKLEKHTSNVTLRYLQLEKPPNHIYFHIIGKPHLSIFVYCSLYFCFSHNAPCANCYIYGCTLKLH